MAFSSTLYLWNKWNIRGFIIMSLLLQVFLILFAPLRKKTMNNRMTFLLWLAYLMADWVATFGIGLISHNQGNLSARAIEVDIALRAFWASFLLLHLGGPDTITAFSLEDNSLWGRHLLSLTCQVGSIIYAFVQIFPSDKSLMFPTMLIFLAGVIKNVERTLALSLSSLPKLREWVLSRQESLDKIGDSSVVEFFATWDGYSHDKEGANLAESTVVTHAYYFFQISKIFLTDLIFTRRQRLMSQEYFHKVSAVDALRVISVELHFIYDVLHTKALVMHSKWSYIFRFVAFTNVVMAFVLFNRLKKHQLPEIDVEITYSLLFRGIAFDVIALLMLIFSDWTIAEVKRYKTGPYNLDSFLHKLVSATYDLRKPLATCEVKPNNKVKYAVLDTPLFFRSWAESISACNLLSESLKESPRKMYKQNWCQGNIAFSNIIPKKIISCFHQVVDTIVGGSSSINVDGKRLTIANTRYVSTNPFIMKLWIFIFEEVRRKSKDTYLARVFNVFKMKMIYESRGEWFLKNIQQEIQCGDFILNSVTKFGYEDSIIMWHIATEIWYNKENLTVKNDEREFSKTLSDYMLYLLLNRLNVVSAVAGIAQIKLAGTLGELRDHVPATKNVKSLCDTIFVQPSQPTHTKYANSRLSQGIQLAKQMEDFSEMKWKLMSGVWVEMLSYAAVHIKGEAHVQVLSQGGELLTFVWLLMIHFGCLYRHEWGTYYGNTEG